MIIVILFVQSLQNRMLYILIIIGVRYIIFSAISANRSNN